MSLANLAVLVDMKKLALCAGLLGFALTLAGCEDAYPPDLRYGVRTDPVLMQPGASLGEERYDPDRPGQLPLLSMAKLDDPRNPLYERRAKIVQENILRDPNLLSSEDRQSLGDILEKLFGRPGSPKVELVTTEQQAALKLDPEQLKKGAEHYRIHCVHCHGVPGDGRGPTAQWVNPHPRDFRAGKFKFQSVDQATTGAQLPPRRADLLRTLEHGLEGSAMPSFIVLTPDEREALVSYVIHLSLRGESELDSIKNDFDLDTASGRLKLKPNEDEPGKPLDLKESIEELHKKRLARWTKAQGMAIKVAPYPYLDDGSTEAQEQFKQSVQRGQQLFVGVANPDADEKLRGLVDKAKCVSCHTDYGRQAQFRWDDWGTLVRPNNFTQGVFRGGRRPVDIYYRIHSGINGSGMSNFGSTLPPDSIWDLVNFVRSLSYPLMRNSMGIKI